MRPRSLKILFALSLSLLTVTLAVWVRSYDAVFVRAYHGKLVLIYVGDQGLNPRTVEQPGQPSGFLPYVEQLLVAVGYEEWVRQDARLLGVRWLRFGGTRALLVPFAYLALIPLALCVTTWFRLRRQVRRQRLGLCMRCGYDLRHSAAACPECGEADRRGLTEVAASESDRDVVHSDRGDAGERLRESKRTV